MTNQVIVNGTQLRAIDEEKARCQKELDKQSKAHEKEVNQLKKAMGQLTAKYEREMLAAHKKLEAEKARHERELAKLAKAHGEEVAFLRKTVTAVDAVSEALDAKLNGDGEDEAKVRKAQDANTKIAKLCQAVFEKD